MLCISHKIYKTSFSKLIRKNYALYKKINNASKCIWLAPCPYNKNEPNLALSYSGGKFLCNACGKIGPYSLFKQNAENAHLFNNLNSSMNTCLGDKIANLIDCSKSDDLVNLTKPHIKESPLLKNLTLDTLREYGVHISTDGGVIHLPHYGLYNKVHNVLVDTPFKSESARFRFDDTCPDIKNSTLFGLNLLLKAGNLKFEKLYISHNEFDAMAVRQLTGEVSVAFRGSKLDMELLLLFAFVREIVLVYPFTTDLTDSLGVDRCSFKKFPANPLVMVNTEMRMDTHVADCEAVKRIATKEFPELFAPSNEMFISFANLRENILGEIMNYDRICGIQWTRMKELNKLLKGFRRGELTVITGLTGCGKTTFASEYSLDLLCQGVSTLWGNFEMKDTTLLKTMITQYAQMDSPEKLISKFDKISEEFGRLPLRLMSSKTSHSPEKLFEALSKAVDQFDVSHVVIDNLQFIVGSNYGTFKDRFNDQDRIFHMLRLFATDKNVHMTVIIHPRKSSELECLTISSISGTAVCTQEADNIIIMQSVHVGDNGYKRNYIEVVKNRFDGDCGIINFNFNKKNRCFFDKLTTTKSDRKSDILNDLKNMTNDDIKTMICDELEIATDNFQDILD